MAMPKDSIVENQIIFPRNSLVYLLPFFVQYPPSFYTLFCFIFVPFFCIYIGVSILCSLLNHSIKKSFLYFSHFTWYQSYGRLRLGFYHGSKSDNPSRGRIALRPTHLHLWNPPPSSYQLGCRKKFSTTFPATLFPISNPSFGIASI